MLIYLIIIIKSNNVKKKFLQENQLATINSTE